MKIEERNEKVQSILQKHGIAITDQLVVDFLVLLENEWDEVYSLAYKSSQQRLTDKELLFVAYLLEQGSAAISCRISEDMNDDVHKIFSPQEKRDLMLQFGEYNGETESPDESPLYISLSGSAMSDFMAYKIVEKLSNKIGIEACSAEELYPYFRSEESIAQLQENEIKKEAEQKERDRARKLEQFQKLKEELGMSK